MTNYNFTNGKQETKTYKEISNVAQGVYSANEVLRTVSTDDIESITNDQYDTRFEEVKKEA